ILHHTTFISLLPTHTTFFFLTHPPPTETYPLSLHDALPICATPSRKPSSGRRRSPSARGTSSRCGRSGRCERRAAPLTSARSARSEEHTSELQSPYDLVCRLLLEKKKKKKK